MSGRRGLGMVAMEVAAVTAVFLAISIYSYSIQEVISVSDGKGWDGVDYYTIAQQMESGQALSARAPFAFRIGTPWLATIWARVTGWELIDCFRAVNILANYLSSLLLLYWLRLFFSNRWLRIAAVVIYMLSWHGPVRFVFFYPVYTDPWSFVFLISGLILVRRTLEHSGWINILGVGMLSLVGALFRENLLVIPVSLLIGAIYSADVPARFPWPKTLMARIGKLSIPLVCGNIGLMIARMVVSPTGDYGVISHTLNWIYDKPIVAYITAWFFIFGPVIILPIYDWRGSLFFLKKYPYLAAYMVVYAVFGWIGGTDTERILFGCVPVICVLVLNSVEKLKPWLTPVFVIVLIAAQAVSQKWLLAFTVGQRTVDFHSAALSMRDKIEIAYTSYFSSLSVFCNHRLLLAYLFFYLLLSAVFWSWLRYNVWRSDPGRTASIIKQL